MGQTSRRCCWHMAGISAGFEATKVEACFKPSQKRDERGRKVRKVGLFLFWICNVMQSLQDCQEGNAWKLVNVNWIHSQWEFLAISFWNSECFSYEDIYIYIYLGVFFVLFFHLQNFQCHPGSQQQNQFHICHWCLKHEQRIVYFQTFPSRGQGFHSDDGSPRTHERLAFDPRVDAKQSDAWSFFCLLQTEVFSVLFGFFEHPSCLSVYNDPTFFFPTTCLLIPTWLAIEETLARTRKWRYLN